MENIWRLSGLLRIERGLAFIKQNSPDKIGSDGQKPEGEGIMHHFLVEAFPSVFSFFGKVSGMIQPTAAARKRTNYDCQPVFTDEEVAEYARKHPDICCMAEDWPTLPHYNS